MTEVETGSFEPKQVQRFTTKDTIKSQSKELSSKSRKDPQNSVKNLSILLSPPKSEQDILEREYKKQTKESEKQFVQRVKSEYSDCRALMVDVNKRKVIDTADSLSRLGKDIDLTDLDEEDVQVVPNYDRIDNDKSRRLNSALRN